MSNTCVLQYSVKFKIQSKCNQPREHHLRSTSYIPAQVFFLINRPELWPARVLRYIFRFRLYNVLQSSRTKYTTTNVATFLQFLSYFFFFLLCCGIWRITKATKQSERIFYGSFNLLLILLGLFFF